MVRSFEAQLSPTRLELSPQQLEEYEMSPDAERPKCPLLHFEPNPDEAHDEDEDLLLQRGEHSWPGRNEEKSSMRQWRRGANKDEPETATDQSTAHQHLVETVTMEATQHDALQRARQRQMEKRGVSDSSSSGGRVNKEDHCTAAFVSERQSRAAASFKEGPPMHREDGMAADGTRDTDAVGEVQGRQASMPSLLSGSTVRLRPSSGNKGPVDSFPSMDQAFPSERRGTAEPAVARSSPNKGTLRIEAALSPSNCPVASPFAFLAQEAKASLKLKAAAQAETARVAMANWEEKEAKRQAAEEAYESAFSGEAHTQWLVQQKREEEQSGGKSRQIGKAALITVVEAAFQEENEKVSVDDKAGAFPSSAIVLAKGVAVRYIKTRELVTVVGVHVDPPGPPYYTIAFSEDPNRSREKQTTAENLERVHPEELSVAPSGRVSPFEAERACEASFQAHCHSADRIKASIDSSETRRMVRSAKSEIESSAAQQVQAVVEAHTTRVRVRSLAAAAAAEVVARERGEVTTMPEGTQKEATERQLARDEHRLARRLADDPRSLSSPAEVAIEAVLEGEEIVEQEREAVLAMPEGTSKEPAKRKLAEDEARVRVAVQCATNRVDEETVADAVHQAHRSLPQEEASETMPETMHEAVQAPKGLNNEPRAAASTLIQVDQEAAVVAMPEESLEEGAAAKPMLAAHKWEVEERKAGAQKHEAPIAAKEREVQAKETQASTKEKSDQVAPAGCDDISPSDKKRREKVMQNDPPKSTIEEKRPEKSAKGARLPPRLGEGEDVYSFTWENPQKLKIKFEKVVGTTVVVHSVLQGAPADLCDLHGWVLHGVDGLPVHDQGKQRVQQRMKLPGPMSLSFSPHATPGAYSAPVTKPTPTGGDVDEAIDDVVSLEGLSEAEIVEETEREIRERQDAPLLCHFRTTSVTTSVLCEPKRHTNSISFPAGKRSSTCSSWRKTQRLWIRNGTVSSPTGGSVLGPRSKRRAQSPSLHRDSVGWHPKTWKLKMSGFSRCLCPHVPLSPFHSVCCVH